MLEKNVPAYALAQVAQREWKMMPKSQPQSLARAIRDFRKRVFTDIQLARLDADREEKKKLDYLEMKAEGITEKVNALEVKAWAVLAQQKRVMLLIEKESLTTIAFNFTDRSMRVLNELTTSLLKWQVELGVLPHAPTEIYVQMKHEFAGLMANTVGSDREKVYNASMKFIEEIDKRSLTLKQNPDGSYAYQPKKKGGSNNDSVGDNKD